MRKFLITFGLAAIIGFTTMARAEPDYLAPYSCNGPAPGCTLLVVMRWFGGRYDQARYQQYCDAREMGIAPTDMPACIAMMHQLKNDGFLHETSSGAHLQKIDAISCVWVRNIEEIIARYPDIIVD